MNTDRLREAKRKILPLAKAAPWVGAETCAAIDRAMAHHPADRFRSYDDLLAALNAARQRQGEGKEKREKEGGATSRAGDRVVLAAAAALAIGALAFSVWWMTRKEPAPPVAESVVEPAVSPAGADDGGADALRVGGVYREAGDALRAGDYEKARTLFAAVRDDGGAMEPTASWAACEAVICAYFDGRPGEARKDAAAAVAHIEAADGIDGEIRAALAGALRRTRDLRPMEASGDDAVPTGPGLIAALIGGLKNWEHGMPAAAAPHFEAVMRVDARGADTWAEPYREIVAGYLADYEKLAAAEPQSLPDDAADCRALADEYHALHAGLKTKGRARFNVRAWQLELEKRARALDATGEKKEDTPPAPPGPPVDLLAEARKAAESCDFVEAVKLLKSADDSEKRNVLLALTEAAAAFLGDLEERLQADGTVVLKTREGEEIPRVTGSRSGGVRTADASGEERDFTWAELSPDSLIELHRALVRSESSELERLRRHEQAIAYDLLAGNPERAKEAAAALAASSPAFKRRWEKVLPAME